MSILEPLVRQRRLTRREALDASLVADFDLRRKVKGSDVRCICCSSLLSPPAADQRKRTIDSHARAREAGIREKVRRKVRRKDRETWTDMMPRESRLLTADSGLKQTNFEERTAA